MNGWIDTKALREHTSTKKVPCELDQIHTYLAAVGASCKYIFEYTNCFKFEMPAWVARLPTQVGYPAGSLSADEWKCLSLVYGPIVVCTLLVYNSIFKFPLRTCSVTSNLGWVVSMGRTRSCQTNGKLGQKRAEKTSLSRFRFYQTCR